MKAKIVQKNEIAEGTLYTKFSVDEDLDFKAGQFFRLTLLNPPYADSRGSSRFLGFVNSPSQNRIVETVTRLGPSSFKRSLNDASLGTEVEIDGIAGEMTLPEDTNTSWIIVTGGIGIVPYMSMFRAIEEKPLSYKIVLIYSNTRKSWAIFMDELEKYAGENPDFDFVPTMTQDPEWGGEKRRIDEIFLKEKIAKPKNSLFYISGTQRFVPSMVKAVKGLGVEKGKIKFEVFTGY